MATDILIYDITPRIQYTGDGTQTAFTYPFPIFADGDIEVYLDDTLKTITTDYTVAGAGDSAGGTVTILAAPLSGIVVTLLRNIPIKRTTDFQEGGEFRAKVINDELDKMTAGLQQVEVEAGRG
ncbi:MAG: hydrolase, partial [Rhodospirillaceae bacterium]|nr:hydrolase [Rhodospirillaceae bacterium]